jgi:hypothetical protein
MKRGAAVIVGVTAGVAALTGYWFDPAEEVTLVVSLVCGTAAAFYQLSVRDFLSRVQTQIDRGADMINEDGGAMLDDNRDVRDRVAALAKTQLIFAALAPSFAAARSIYNSPILSGAAIACAMAAIVLALMLDGASRQFSRLVEDERCERVRRDHLAVVAKERKTAPSVDQIVADNPNLKNYSRSPLEAESH